jgi:hypothetical protein
MVLENGRELSHDDTGVPRMTALPVPAERLHRGVEGPRQRQGKMSSDLTRVRLRGRERFRRTADNVTFAKHRADPAARLPRTAIAPVLSHPCRSRPTKRSALGALDSAEGGQPRDATVGNRSPRRAHEVQGDPSLTDAEVATISRGRMAAS